MAFLRIRRVALAIPLMLTLGCAGASKSARTPASKLEPEELAFMEMAGPIVSFISQNYREIQFRRQKIKECSERGNSDLAKYFYLELVRDFNEFSTFLNALPTPTGPALQTPESVSDLRMALVAFGQLAPLAADGALSQSDCAYIEDAARRVVETDESLAATWNSRPADYSHQEMSYNFTMQYGAVPIKLDIATNEVKVTHSFHVGPLKLNASAGPAARTGIKTLVIQDRRLKRVFAIGHKPISVHVPESIVETHGDTMYITAVD